MVPRDADGLGINRLSTIDRTRHVAELTFDNVRADALNGGNDASAAITAMVATGRTLIAADTLGAGQHMIEKAVAYAMERQQFGRTIGSFQAVKHLCAEMAARLEPCRSLVWYAAHTANAEPRPSRWRLHWQSRIWLKSAPSSPALRPRCMAAWASLT